MRIPTRAEFRITEDGLKAIHEPTGWEGSTYRYEDPKNLSVQWQRMVDVGEYDQGAIVALATELLRQAAKARSKP
jgi:hypothetical protein